MYGRSADQLTMAPKRKCALFHFWCELKITFKMWLKKKLTHYDSLLINPNQLRIFFPLVSGEPALSLKNQEACRSQSQSDSSFFDTWVNWQVVHLWPASPSSSSLPLAKQRRAPLHNMLLTHRWGSTVGDQWLEGGLSCCRVLWHYN